MLIPLQWKQARMAKAFRHQHEVPAAYWRLLRRWAVVGTIATLLSLANLYFMVWKLRKRAVPRHNQHLAG